MSQQDLPPGVCNSTAIRKAARHLGRFYDQCLAQADLRNTQYAILNLLATRGRSRSPNWPSTWSPIAQRWDITCALSSATGSSAYP